LNTEDLPAHLVALRDCFGDLRHWIGSRAPNGKGFSRRCRRGPQCPGCLAGIKTDWHGYIPAERLLPNGVRKLVAWHIPEGNGPDVEGDLRGLPFDVRKAPPHSPKLQFIALFKTPRVVELRESFDMDFYLDYRESRFKPVQPIPGIDELGMEAIAGWLAAEACLFKPQPSLLDFLDVPEAPPPAALPIPDPVAEMQKMRAMLLDGIRRNSPNGDRP
jgi:hypothetical protein